MNQTLPRSFALLLGALLLGLGLALHAAPSAAAWGDSHHPQVVTRTAVSRVPGGRALPDVVPGALPADPCAWCVPEPRVVALDGPPAPTEPILSRTPLPRALPRAPPAAA